MPATYRSSSNGNAPQFISFEPLYEQLDKLTAKYGPYAGFSTANPHAAPPTAGAYQGGPQERSFPVTIVVPEHRINEAKNEVCRFAADLKKRYNQDEIFLHSYPVVRYIV